MPLFSATKYYFPNRYRPVLNLSLTILIYAITLIVFFPILWIWITAFKSEADAFASPPIFLFHPTLSNFREILPAYLPAFKHSIIAALSSTFLSFVLALPAAYALSQYPTRRTRITLLWVLSTRMMPPVGLVVPLFILYKYLHLLDHIFGLIIVYTMINLPLAIWMMYSYLSEIPPEIFEAARVDGANGLQEFTRIAFPLILPGFAATALLLLIFSWNEVFFSLNLTSFEAIPLSVYMTSYKTSQGLFWAHMSAAATLTTFPVLIFGWFAQRHLVRGITYGALH